MAEGECIVCHRADYELSRTPPHTPTFPVTCGDCHVQTHWSPARDFDHDAHFPLLEAHARATCVACHTRGFEPGDTPSDCAGCHLEDYETATAPPHEGYPLDCASCHSQTAFRPSTFEHDWPLRNAHARTACGSCHTGDPPIYEGTPSSCVGCHLQDYESALNPSHDGFSTDCADCHDDSSWRGGGRLEDHEWPLLGAHASATCASCHLGEPPVYEGTPTTCVGCHAGDKGGVVAPPHDGFSDDCSSCHGNDAWQPASFDHEWPLQGAHASATCASCHLGEPPVYEGTPTSCVGCHADDKGGVVAPPHDGFSDDCSSCHGNDAWQPASFDHAWPLDGQHAGATCSSCHVGSPPLYAGTPTQCVGCHQADYDSSPFPGHDAFSTDCAGCHTTSGWTPASGGHPEGAFPITGRHDYACNDCHNAALGANGRGNADCVGCHEDGVHSRARMDAEHREEDGYPSGDAPPNFCLDCHPRGN